MEYCEKGNASIMPYRLIMTLASFFLVVCSLQAQNDTIDIISDTSLFICRVTSDGNSYAEPNRVSVNTSWSLKKGDVLFAYEIRKSNGTYNLYPNDEFVAVYSGLDSGYVDIKKVTFVDDVIYPEYLRSNPPSIQRQNKAKVAARNFLANTYKKIIAEYDEMDKIGLVITDKDYLLSELNHTIGMKFNFYNGYKKSIKYINLTIQPYNRVGDVMSDELGKSKAIIKAIGPINYGSESSVEYQDLFWNDKMIIDCLRIKKIEVIFMDGKTLNIVDVNRHLAGHLSNCSTIKRSYRLSN